MTEKQLQKKCIEFAKWVIKSGWYIKGNDKFWTHPEHEITLTDEALYQLFSEEQIIQSHK